MSQDDVMHVSGGHPERPCAECDGTGESWMPTLPSRYLVRITCPVCGDGTPLDGSGER